MNYKLNVIEKNQPSMGSEYWVVTHFELTGPYVPEELKTLNIYENILQDPENQVLYVAQWMNYADDPDFCVWKIDVQQKKYWVSETIKGCCSSLDIESGELVVSVFGVVNEQAQEFDERFGITKKNMSFG